MLKFSVKRCLAIFQARNREFFRDKPALAWNLVFPLLLILGFSVIFSDDGQKQLKIGLLNNGTMPQVLDQLRYVSLTPYKTTAEAQKKLEHHQIDLLIDWNSQRYLTNQSSPKGYLAQHLVAAHLPHFSHHYVDGRVVRYVDWVLPGVLGMNIMFSCLFGVGYVIVRYRKNGVLKRLKATPVNALEFVAAQIFSRFFIIVAITTGIFIGTKWVVEFLSIGNYITLFTTLCLGVLAMIGLGFFVASRSASEELTGGLLNLVSFPMMILSNVWFSLESAPGIVKVVAQLLPLTHFVEAARAIMLEGAGFADITHNLASLALMIVVFFGASARFFHWGEHR